MPHQIRFPRAVAIGFLTCTLCSPIVCAFESSRRPPARQTTSDQPPSDEDWDHAAHLLGKKLQDDAREHETKIAELWIREQALAAKRERARERWQMLEKEVYGNEEVFTAAWKLSQIFKALPAPRVGQSVTQQLGINMLGDALKQQTPTFAEAYADHLAELTGDGPMARAFRREKSEIEHEWEKIGGRPDWLPDVLTDTSWVRDAKTSEHPTATDKNVGDTADGDPRHSEPSRREMIDVMRRAGQAPAEPRRPRYRGHHSDPFMPRDHLLDHLIRPIDPRAVDYAVSDLVQRIEDDRRYRDHFGDHKIDGDAYPDLFNENDTPPQTSPPDLEKQPGRDDEDDDDPPAEDAAPTTVMVDTARCDALISEALRASAAPKKVLNPNWSGPGDLNTNKWKEVPKTKQEKARELMAAFAAAISCQNAAMAAAKERRADAGEVAVRLEPSHDILERIRDIVRRHPKLFEER